MKSILASLSFFTRLPFWKLANLESKHYASVVHYWTLSSVITSGVMVLSFFIFKEILPMKLALILSLGSRVLVTGALHEDGFADFFDGFGAGRDKNRVLSIMKDSHIGVYGVLSLIIYYIIVIEIYSLLDASKIVVLMIMADASSKFISSFITYLLPYARDKEGSKSGVVYSSVDYKGLITSVLFISILIYLFFSYAVISAFLAITIFFLVYVWFLKKRIGGYTGDCCGASYIFMELIFCIVYLVSTYEDFIH